MLFLRLHLTFSNLIQAYLIKSESLPSQALWEGKQQYHLFFATFLTFPRFWHLVISDIQVFSTAMTVSYAFLIVLTKSSKKKKVTFREVIPCSSSEDPMNSLFLRPARNQAAAITSLSLIPAYAPAEYPYNYSQIQAMHIFPDIKCLSSQEHMLQKYCCHLCPHEVLITFLHLLQLCFF